MSTDITKKQHYVWRKYLNAWKVNQDDKDIWTGFIQSKEVKKVALMSVAQSSYFYKLEELTDEELKYLRLFCCNSLSPDIQEVANVIVDGYDSFTFVKRAIASGKINADESFKHDLKKIEMNSFEKIQSMIEKNGNGLLKCSSINDVKAIAQNDIYDILSFLMVQYMRTKSRRDRFVNSLKARPNLQSFGDKCWPFFSIVTALQVVERYKSRNDYRLLYVNNNSSVPFITGDQPIVNALGDIEDENGDVKDLELYYPLSPQTALVISCALGDKFSEMVVDEKYVKERNKMIKNESLTHIFANDDNILKAMLT